MSNVLDQIRKVTTIVADTADIAAIKQFRPVDATTNPSLLLAATKLEIYKHFIKDSVDYAKSKSTYRENVINLATDKLFVLVGKEILKFIPGRVSTEIDARLAFDKEAQVRRALSLIELYKEEDISKDRILIKIPSTWEGIQAAKILENEYGIHCNMTLLFNFYQAVACAEAGVTLISPFVGRILDWYQKNTDTKEFNRYTDPGVVSVCKIYEYYKKFGYNTQIMAASFRNTEQIKGLAGCDLLTISSALLEQLSNDNEQISVILNPEKAALTDLKQISVTESIFRYEMNEDAMACDKLADGIRRFAADGKTIEKLIEAAI
ncbi:unnamed protein product [Dracunculus medinensis]|uniref:Transaldolase n=1 Tax=Dracunculus medinensis TaxID=318479 RepID=A0A0N4UKB1_DRAME|nr:unnamed protein product [Dracunculus medinensis]